MIQEGAGQQGATSLILKQNLHPTSYTTLRGTKDTCLGSYSFFIALKIAASELSSHTQNRSGQTHIRPALGTSSLAGDTGPPLDSVSLRHFLFLLPEPGMGEGRGGFCWEGSRWTFSARPAPSHFGEKALPPYSLPKGNAFCPQPTGGLGQAGV